VLKKFLGSAAAITIQDFYHSVVYTYCYGKLYVVASHIANRSSIRVFIKAVSQKALFERLTPRNEALPENLTDFS
jgi:hypothetical protein